MCLLTDAKYLESNTKYNMTMDSHLLKIFNVTTVKRPAKWPRVVATLVMTK